MKRIILLLLLLFGCGQETKTVYVPVPTTFYLYNNSSMLDEFLEVNTCLSVNGFYANRHGWVANTALFVTEKDLVTCTTTTGIVCGDGYNVNLIAYSLDIVPQITETNLNGAFIHLLLGTQQGDNTGSQCE